MWRKAAWVAPAVVVALLCFALSRRERFIVPQTFPVLAPDQLDSDRGPPGESELATLGSGCFWCTEAVFRQMKGVTNAVCGYSGGHARNPTYKQVCGGTTGHAEVVQVTIDPAVISYPELLEVFWRSHDPTTLNRQGNDLGTQYRSVVFYHSDRQRRAAERYKGMIDAAGVFDSSVVTEIVPFVEFYPAESDHQDFYARNPRQGYCRAVIGPKLDKLRKVFQDRLKPE
jgi:peptide-methionine (S)-S-oxide reductase